MNYKKLWFTIKKYNIDLISIYKKSPQYCKGAELFSKHVVWKMDELENEQNGK